MDIVPLFCDVDDFCNAFEPTGKHRLLADGNGKRQRAKTLYLSEVMTIIIWFHHSSYRTFKAYYTQEVVRHLSWAFPPLVSYNRFVELMQEALIPLCAYLQTRKGRPTGIALIDSLPITVCHHRRIASHTVFAGLAQRGKNSVDWFYGFKLHLVINEQGEFLACCVTPGNVDDRVPVPKLVKGLLGKLFGNRGYISQPLFELLFAEYLHLITTIRKHMKQKLMPLIDRILLRKRSLIETIHDQLKNISQIEHTRHRSVMNFCVNLVAALIAYSYREKKPSLNIWLTEFKQLPATVF